MKETYILVPPRDLEVGGTSIRKWQGLDWCQVAKALASVSGSLWGWRDRSRRSVGPWTPDLSPPTNIRNSHREKSHMVYYSCMVSIPPTPPKKRYFCRSPNPGHL